MNHPSSRHKTTSIPSRSVQTGASLFVAIVALVLMTIAGLSLMRSVDTGNIIAGNMAFKGSTVTATDAGVEGAAAYLNTTVAPSPDGNLPAGCSVGTPASDVPPVAAVLGNCRYSARIQPEDKHGVPLIDWSNTANIPVASLNGNDVQFVIERLCNPDPVQIIELGQVAKDEVASSLCGISPVPDTNSKSTVLKGTSQIVEVMYRITVRVSGPRNTIVTVQSIQAR